MSEHREFEELVALYALDALDAADQKRLEGHLASGCDRCTSELNDARRVSNDLLTLVTPTVPGDAVRTQLMDRARSENDGRDRRPPAWLGLAAAAAMLAAIALGIYARSLSNALEQAIAARETAEAELSRLSDTLGAVTSPQNRAVSLAGQDAAPSARATAFLDPENRRLFLYVENLPALPPDRTYQIWLLVDGTPVSVGTFDVGADGRARLDGEPLPAFQGRVNVAVTEEPAGGVPQPTGPMVLLGS